MNSLNYQNYSGPYSDRNIYNNCYYRSNFSAANNFYNLQQPINMVNTNINYVPNNSLSSMRSSTDTSNHRKIPKHHGSEKRQVKFDNNVKVFEVQSFKTYNKIDDSDIESQIEYFGTNNYKSNLKKDCVICNGCVVM